MDWIGGGLRLWVVAREIHPEPAAQGDDPGRRDERVGRVPDAAPVRGGADDDLHDAALRRERPRRDDLDADDLHRHGGLLRASPARWRSCSAPASRSASTGNVLGLSLYDLFLGSLGIFAGLGVLMVIIIVFPALAHGVISPRGAVGRRRSRRIAARLEKLLAGIDEAHASVVRFNTPRGWLSLLLGHPPLRPVPRQQAARRLRGAPGHRRPRATSSTCCWCRRWSPSCSTSRRRRAPAASPSCSRPLVMSVYVPAGHDAALHAASGGPS